MITIDELRQRSLPFVRADQEGVIEEVNDLMQEVYGWASEDLIGNTLGLILPSAFQDAHHLGFSRFRMTGESEILNHPLKLKTVCKDKREILSEHFIVAERHGMTWSFAATLKPLE
ncbi:PAS domain S-box protein [Cyanobium gracile]|uniref:PAS domain S-box protein n=1 Tax=Cyanobium gracile UHCC 0281 TaxID=3110309 RepID=A0ABU5SYY0_9CYAN|nr:PAS domain S-box protein [Cyanobium gracile]MEA5443728.1 PAS domain S-box protein [Cyanobium gracile UHCC 0281]